METIINVQYTFIIMTAIMLVVVIKTDENSRTLRPVVTIFWVAVTIVVFTTLIRIWG